MKQPELGAYITTLRNKKGLTQKELAGHCNVDIRTIQRIENGDVVPRIYTINLLSKALDDEITLSADTGIEVAIDEKYIQQIRFAWIWSIIFSVNYIGVVYNVINHSTNLFGKFSIAVNIVGYILFSKGFYHLGKKYNNQLLAISTLLSMPLIVFVNLLYLAPVLLAYYVPIQYFWQVMLIYSLPVYAFMCVCAIFIGIGMFRQGNKVAKAPRFNLYHIAGVVGIVQSIMFFTFNFRIQSAGLIISAFCNVLTIVILYNEYRGNERPAEKTKAGLLLS
jgi:transcriptional regulator with XRE-family HTH domain